MLNIDEVSDQIIFEIMGGGSQIITDYKGKSFETLQNYLQNKWTALNFLISGLPDIIFYKGQAIFKPCFVS